MSTQPTQPAPAPNASKKRRGVVLVAVLIVVASLSLAGYHYSDMMVAESKASEYSHRRVQAHRFAESGIHYAAAMLSDPDSFANLLGGNPYDNEAKFKDQVVIEKDGLKGYFSIIAPPDVDDAGNTTACLYGVTDEGGKINLNAIMKSDPTGQRLYDMLKNMKLPDLTEDIINALLDWLDADIEARPGGAEEYAGYRCKNGPIDSIDELLLVKGVTRELLYGTDINRNGFEDEDDKKAPGYTAFSRGWSAYFTVHSREQNHDQTNVPYIFLNNIDLTQLYTALIDDGIDDDMAKYIVMYRQYPTSNTSGQTQSTLGTLASLFSGKSSKSSSSTTVQGKLEEYQVKLTKLPSYEIKSVFALVDSQVSIKSVDPKNPKRTITTVYTSPLKDPARQSVLLPKLFALATLVDPATSPEILGRININSAPREVLASLPELSENDVEKILSARRPLTEAHNSPAWLLTEAKLSNGTCRDIEKFITTRSQVYRVQSVGYFEGKGPTIRVEAVIDTNSGRPRIIAWRDYSELGKGWNEKPMP